jgi:hypothetical protein
VQHQAVGGIEKIESAAGFLPDGRASEFAIRILNEQKLCAVRCLESSFKLPLSMRDMPSAVV